MKNTKTYIALGLIIAGLSIGTVAFAAYGKQFQRAELFGVVEEKVPVYKLVDGATTCYIVGKGYTISCVK